MRILRHGHIPCIDLCNFYCGEGWVISVKIHGFEFILILVLLRDCEHIVQTIPNMITVF